MKILYNSIKLLALALVVVLSSCAKDQGVDTQVNTDRFKAKLLFNVAQSTSKAGATESDVQRIDIMLFSDGRLEKVMRNITSFSTSTDGYSSVEIGMDTEGIRKAYVVANLDNEAWLNSLVVGSTTIEELASFQTSNLTKMANPPLVMYGISSDIDFSTGQSSVLCQLYRVVARIDVDNKASNFTLTSARLLNSKIASTIFPSSTISNSAVKDFEAEAASGSTSIKLYSYENGVADTEQTTKVEISGTVNGNPLTYIVDLVQNDNLIPVERNFLYTVNINDVQPNDIDASITVRPWKLGSDINEVVTGSSPVVDITIDPEVGTYSKADSTITLTSKGGEIIFDAQANAECGMEISDSWLSLAPQTKAGSVIEGRFVVNTTENTSEQPRTATIDIYNKINSVRNRFTITQAAAESQDDKYMVVVVAGQSNASGYDQSAVNLNEVDAPDSRAFQLSYRKGVAPNQNLSIIPLAAKADNIDAGALKGIHLPLAKELIKYIPSGYNILVIPVSYTGTTFSTAVSTLPWGTYNVQSKTPNEMSSGLRWGVNSAYTSTIIERTKYALDLNIHNKFLGVVWCQGENDKADADFHYPAFTQFADHVMTQLSSYGGRTAYGTVDKRLWFTYSSAIYWMDWYNNASDGDATGVFGGYKYWNPDGFIHIPATTAHSNPSDKYHFGQGAFASLVAPMVAQRMNENGVLFNGNEGKTNHFADKTTPADAVMYGGSLTDSDVATSLLLYMPFNESNTDKLYGNAIVASKGLQISPAVGLKDINSNSRNRNALQITKSEFIKFKSGPNVSDWSISFLAKRIQGSNTENVQSLISNGATTNSPFIGFKKYFAKSGVVQQAEFLCEPIVTTVKNNALPGLFVNADNVRDLNDWIHYVITFNNTTKRASLYMNGELVNQRVIPTTQVTSFSNLTIGYVSSTMPGAEAQLADLGIWGKVLQVSTVKKLFLMSYYGYTR